MVGGGIDIVTVGLYFVSGRGRGVGQDVGEDFFLVVEMGM